MAIDDSGLASAVAKTLRERVVQCRSVVVTYEKHVKDYSERAQLLEALAVCVANGSITDGDAILQHVNGPTAFPFMGRGAIDENAMLRKLLWKE